LILTVWNLKRRTRGGAQDRLRKVTRREAYGARSDSLAVYFTSKEAFVSNK
jgi:hypothetical protein